MLKRIAWITGYAGRKTADYLTGTDTTRGKIEEITLAYKAGTRGYHPTKPKTVADEVDQVIAEWAEANGWTK